MFVPELEKQRALKLAANKQYYNDLRAQIEEKARKTQSPLPYSTTNQSNLSQAVSSQRRYNQISQQAPQGSPHSINSSSKNSFYSNQSYSQSDSTARSNISSPHLSDFAKTSIAPLNLQVTNFNYDTFPDLPKPMKHTNSVDPETFGERVRSIQSQMDEQKNDFVFATESQDRIKSQSFPSVFQLINEIENLLEKTVSAKIPNLLKNVNEMTDHNREILGTTDANFASISNVIRDSLSEKQTKISSFQTKLAEFVDSVSNSILDIRADSGRQRDMLDLMQQKLSKLEKKDAQTIEALSKSNSDFETVDGIATQRFSEIQRDISGVLQSVAQQLSAQIKQESLFRKDVTSQLHSQAEEINNNAASSINAMQESIVQLASAFQTSLNDLSSSITEAIEQTQQETEQMTQDVVAKIDSLVTDTDASIGSISHEIVTTIGDMRDSFSASRNSLETAMNSENVSRSRNHEAIKDKYSHFKNIVAKEQDIQMNHVEEMCEGMAKRMQEYSDKIMQPLNVDIAYIKAKKIEMDRVESMVEKLEAAVTQNRNQIFESIGSLQRSIDNISGSINETRISLSTKIDELNVDLQSIESCNKSDLAMKDDVMKNQEAVCNETEDRIKFVERQLSAALSNLSQLTIGSDTPDTKIVEPGSVVLQSLVRNEGNETPQKDVEFKEELPDSLPNVEEDEGESNNNEDNNAVSVEEEEIKESKPKRRHRHHHRHTQENEAKNEEESKQDEEENVAQEEEQNNEEEEESHQEDVVQEEVVE